MDVGLNPFNVAWAKGHGRPQDVSHAASQAAPTVFSQDLNVPSSSILTCSLVG